ncbi:MAG: DinB family protein [Bryobacteraceae bacterium]
MLRTTLLACLFTVMASAAGPTAGPGVDRYVKHLQTSRDFTIKVAEQMPDTEFSFKLTPPQMSFAQQLIHIGQANLHFYSALAGQKEPPFAKPTSATKADVIDYLTRSFNYCIDTLQKLSEAQLDKKYSMEDTQMSGWDVVMLSLDHTTHHRAQCEMYLRVKGITPTTYEF